MDTKPDRFQLAFHLANLLLENAEDKQGVPMIDHSCRVLERCRDLSEDQRISALLHDCIEDGSLPWDNSPLAIAETIYRLFGPKVSRVVETLSRNNPYSGHAQTSLTYDLYIEIVSRCKEAIPVKIADLDDNIDDEGYRVKMEDEEERLRLVKRYRKAKKFLLEEFNK